MILNKNGELQLQDAKICSTKWGFGLYGRQPIMIGEEESWGLIFETDSSASNAIIVYSPITLKNSLTTDSAFMGKLNGKCSVISGGYYYAVGSNETNGRRINILASQKDGNKYYLQIRGQFGNTDTEGSYDTYKVEVIPSSSDVRLKRNIKKTSITNAIDIINEINIYSFDWKDGNYHQKIGFVADQLESIDKNLATGGGYNEDGSMDIKQVNSFYLQGYEVKAIQELSAQVKELKQQIKELQSKI